MARTMVDRRKVLQAGALAVGAAALPAAARAKAPGVLLVDTGDRNAVRIAKAARAPGQRLTPLVGDPTRVWRDAVGDSRAPVSGVTRWSDFVILRELAHDSRMLVRAETLHPVARGVLLVSWTFA